MHPAAATARAPVSECALKQRQGTDDIRLHEFGGTVDGSIDMRFRCKIHDRRRTMFIQQFRHERFVANVAVDENVMGVIANTRQRIEIAGVGELVQIDDAITALAQQSEHEIAADEAGAAGDQKGFH